VRSTKLYVELGTPVVAGREQLNMATERLPLVSYFQALALGTAFCAADGTW